MALMSLRSHSRVKAYMVLTKVANLFIHNYIRSFLNIGLRSSLMVRVELKLAYPTICLSMRKRRE